MGMCSTSISPPKNKISLGQSSQEETLQCWVGINLWTYQLVWASMFVLTIHISLAPILDTLFKFHTSLVLVLGSKAEIGWYAIGMDPPGVKTNIALVLNRS